MFAKFVIAGFFATHNEMSSAHPRHDEISLEVQRARAHAPGKLGRNSQPAAHGKDRRVSMRNLVVVAAVAAAALAGCTATNPGAAPTKVSWKYGAGNGDGVSYPGPAPVYKRAYGLETDAVAPPAQEPKVNYSYGAENHSGSMVQQTAPQPAQKVAAPSTAQQPAPRQDQHPAAPGTHS